MDELVVLDELQYIAPDGKIKWFDKVMTPLGILYFDRALGLYFKEEELQERVVRLMKEGA